MAALSLWTALFGVYGLFTPDLSLGTALAATNYHLSDLFLGPDITGPNKRIQRPVLCL